MIKSNFKNWSLAKAEETFGLDRVAALPSLTDWLAATSTNDAEEMRTVTRLQTQLIEKVDGWNEAELSNRFINPLIDLVSIQSRYHGFFIERPIKGIVGNYELSGNVDAMIASGYREPHKPFFCLSEYKKEGKAAGDAIGQVLVEMMVAQSLNNDEQPIYGCYVLGRNWFFLTLEGKRYAKSLAFDSTKDDIHDILRILKGLKAIVERRVGILTNSAGV